ncbi:hypothetical protein K503DRAFT_805671 [Rhizopogon vinicolor AM-OR11-026]|uniref:F-box domain-containing protein n=1 Tax=Rhizopogon vinicolor AM-OR11-026 TaxID=1314800 RepID=A0A1B7MH38_9AGAM|nr:hypothetical protein K503DRAFT_805671 [Rhizopogon vinicolor AM-OR11-026]
MLHVPMFQPTTDLQLTQPSPSRLRLANKMQELELEETTAKSDLDIMPASDIIDALQNILEQSRLMIPDLETTYSKSPNPNQYQASQLKEQPESINAILTERQEQLNTVLRNIPALGTIMIKIKDLRQQLVEEQHKIVHSMTLHRGYKSALWRLPVEVLNQIFIHCLPQTDCWWISSEVAPILLTKICRKWREVAVNLPSLWCRLLVGGYGARQKTAFCYDSWLKRSRQHPLSLQIYYVPKDIAMIQTLLQPYTNQISSLQIILEDIYSQPLFLPNLPALRELTLDGPVSYSFIRSFSCPRLRDFKLKAFVADPIRIKWSFCDAWFYLTNLEITVERSHQCLYLLYQCPNLSFLTVRLSHGAGIQPLESLTHMNLQYLSISCFQLDVKLSLRDLFNALTLPNLCVFDARYIPLPHEAFKALLTRSNLNLERLILGAQAKMRDEHRAEYLALIPSLEVVLSW